MLIEVSNGEIVDKLTIIDIKLSKISDPQKRKNLEAEQDVLEKAVSEIMDKNHELYRKLYDINLKLWVIEDACREFEKNRDFGAAFVETARSVYMTNDERAAVKKEINNLTGSRLTEEKSYQ
jgi:hypothetical protein